MRVRGERECRECGTRWSYFETGDVVCPDCGSLRSVGVGDREVHTAGATSLDWAPALELVGEEPLDRAAEAAAECAREYRRDVGFVDAGELRPLSETALVAAELETVGTALSRSMRPSDAAEAYLLALLRAGLDGERPAPDAVPAEFRSERGLAIARAVADYQRDLRTYLDDVDGPLASSLSAIRAHRKRIEALDGDVDPREAERLVEAIRDVYAYLEDGDEAAIVRVEERFRE